MKFAKVCFFLVITFAGCKSDPGDKAISKLEDYNEKLENLGVDSMQYSDYSFDESDTISINKEFKEHKLNEIFVEKSVLKQVSSNDIFVDVLKNKANLLSQFKPIEGYERSNLVVSNNDFIRRCGAIDRAPNNAERLPIARGARLISLSYYEMEIPVAFHIIIDENGKGSAPNIDSTIRKQIALLNDAYGPFRIKFKLISTDVTANDGWFNNASYYTDSISLKQMTRSLSKNPERVMNIYALGSRNVLGEATYPWYKTKGSFMDYVLINYNTLPEGPSNYFEGKYNLGKTLVHEVGHYLGLLHTFEGWTYRCDSMPPNDGCMHGDEVEDTPSQQVCYFNGCDTSLDSCPTPGKDPVKNYMGYNPDACMSEITKGQGDRIIQCVFKFRPHLISNSIL